MLLLSLVFVMSCFEGCAKTVYVTGEIKVKRLRKDQNFTAPENGYFVNDYTWIKMNEKIFDARE